MHRREVSEVTLLFLPCQSTFVSGPNFRRRRTIATLPLSQARMRGISPSEFVLVSKDADSLCMALTFVTSPASTASWNFLIKAADGVDVLLVFCFLEAPVVDFAGLEVRFFLGGMLEMKGNVKL